MAVQDSQTQWFGFIRGYPRKAINMHGYFHIRIIIHLIPCVSKPYITDKLQKWDQVKKLEPQVFINPRFTCVLTSHPRDGHPTFVFAHFSASQKHQHNPMLRIMQFWQCLLLLQNNHPKIITKVIVEKSILYND